MHNGLTVVSWQLTDVNPGDGGLCLVPGSHKCNFALPLELRTYEQHQEFVKQIPCKAGDVVIFTEAVTHGTLPWQGEHQRRSILFRYSPGNLAYAKHYVDLAGGVCGWIERGTAGRDGASLPPPPRAPGPGRHGGSWNSELQGSSLTLTPSPIART